MRKIRVLERRFNAAVDALAASSGDSAEVEILTTRVSELETQGQTNTSALAAATASLAAETAKLEAVHAEGAVKTVDANKTAKIGEKRLKIIEEQGEELDALKLEKTELEQANAALKAENTTLASAEADTSELENELTNLRAQREADVEEVNAILNRLTPLVEGS